MVRRELLYTAVRDSMVRAGVLSSGYKFKVLSLDQRGAQFLVMVDLAPEYGANTLRLGEIETLITQTAKARFDIWVTAVYWRVATSLSAQEPKPAPAARTGTAAARTSPAGEPAPSPAVPPAPAAPLIPPPIPSAPVEQAAQRYEPIEADEVAAFKQALQQAAATRAPDAQTPPGTPRRSGPLLPPSSSETSGFEDTVIHHDAPELAPTQYGTLR